MKPATDLLKPLLQSKASLGLGLAAGMFAYAATVGQPALAEVRSDVHNDAVTYADGIGSDSAPNNNCAPGYYYCWSNVQQKAVCTTRNCYGSTRPRPPTPP